MNRLQEFKILVFFRYKVRYCLNLLKHISKFDYIKTQYSDIMIIKMVAVCHNIL